MLIILYIIYDLTPLRVFPVTLPFEFATIPLWFNIAFNKSGHDLRINKNTYTIYNLRYINRQISQSFSDFGEKIVSSGIYMYPCW